ncbi:MAG: AsmA family protein [Pseudomonadota bacterium]
MGKLLKFLGWLLGILIVLIIALVVFVSLFVDPNEHKETIVSEVKKATGRDLSITGDIGLSVFPWLGLELSGLRLSNAPGFGEQDFASLAHANVRVKLLPLVFQQTLEVDRVRVEGLELNLAKSKKGATNWQDMTGRHAGQPAELPADLGEEPSAGGLAAFSIGGVAIRNAHVVWDDQSTGERYEIKGLQLETGALSPGKPVEISLGLSLESQQPAMQGRVDLSGTLNTDPDQQVISFETLRLDLNVKGEGLPKEGLEAQLRADLALNRAAETLDISNLTITSGELVLSGLVQGEAIHSAPTFAGELKLKEFAPRQWLKQLELPLPETADPEVLQKLSISTAFNATPDLVAMRKLSLVLDDTHIKGDLELLNPAAPLYKFNLDIDQIDLDRYLPPPSEAAEAEKPAKPAKEEPLFPVEMLRNLNLDGNLRINSLTAQNIHAEAIQIRVVSKEGQLKIDEQIGRFYDGLIKGGVVLDVRGKTPQLKLDQQATHILAGPLLRDLTDTDKLEGSGDFSANVTSSGETISQLKKGLNGSLNFNFADGAVKGVNLAKMIREAKAKFSGGAVPIADEPEQTDFSEMSGSAVIQNGILNNRDLLAKSPFLRIEGDGKVNIVMENMDYTVRPVIVNTSKGQGGQGLEELEGIPIPIHLTGTWAEPKWRVDLVKVLEEKQKEKLKEKVDEKLQEKLPDLKEKLPDALKGFL